MDMFDDSHQHSPNPNGASVAYATSTPSERTRGSVAEYYTEMQ